MQKKQTTMIYAFSLRFQAGAPIEWQGEIRTMSSSVSLTTSTFRASSSERSSKQQHFSRSYSLASSCSDDLHAAAAFKLCAQDRRFSLDDILDEKEEVSSE